MQQLEDEDPRSIADYELVGRLGEGGTGVVFEAIGPDGARVALKVLHREFAASPVLRARLGREAEALRRVHGGRVARVLAVDAESDTPYIVMELAEGETLAAIVERGPLRGGMLTGLAEGLIEALGDVHAAGIVHRDLKPSNIIFGPGGVRIVDFGISAFEELAASTRTGALVGTPAWLSPEQATGGQVGPAADIHNLGMVLTLAATGRHPYGQGRPDAMLYRIVHQEPQLEGLPSALAPWVAACLAKDPADRPTLRDLAETVTGSPSGSSGSGRTRMASATRVASSDMRPPRLLRWKVVVGAAVVASVAAVAGWFGLDQVDSRGPLTVTYIDRTSTNPQLGEAVLEVTAPGMSDVVIRVDPQAAPERVDRRGEWRLSAPVTVRYRPSSAQSDGYLETFDLRAIGMDALSRSRTLRIELTVTDEGSAIELSPARGLRALPSGVNDVQLARPDEAEVLRLEEKAEQERRDEESRRQAERERELEAERDQQEQDLEAARQQRVAEARARRNSCTSSTRALWDAQFAMVYFIESSYFSARGSLITGGTVSPYGYQLAIWSLDGIMVDNHNTARSTLSGTPGGNRINPAVSRTFDASGSLIDAWRALNNALSVPREYTGARYSDVLPREHAAIDRAQNELLSAVSALRDAVNRDAAADCARQYPDP